jgi:hypothetical protein
MQLTIKILITLTQLFIVFRAVATAVSVTTVSILADKSARLTEAQRNKADDMVGKSTLVAIGTLFWQGILGAGVWIWL